MCYVEMAQRSRRRLSFEVGVHSDENQVPCGLCGQVNGNLSAPQTWKDSAAVRYASSHHIASDCLVCRPCRHEISRVLKNPQLTSRWNKDKVRGCCTMCDKPVFSTMKQAPDQDCLRELGIDACLDIPVPTPLCQQHYFAIKNREVVTRCPTCNVSLPLCGHVLTVSVRTSQMMWMTSWTGCSGRKMQRLKYLKWRWPPMRTEHSTIQSPSQTLAYMFFS